MEHQGDRGEGAVSYLGVILLVAGVAIGLVTSDVGATVAGACKDAVCRVAGGDCSRSPQARARGSGGGARTEPLLKTNPNAPMGDWDNFLPRPPVPKPTCTPNPDSAWVEGLHAHNDYVNKRPLLDALDNGATSVEADLFLNEDGQLYPKHNYDNTGRGVSFKDLYIDPLMERAEKNGGQIYPGRDPNRPFQIIVELKAPNMQEGTIPRWVVDEKTKESYLHSKRVEAYWATIRQTEELRTKYPNVQVVFSGGTPRELVGKPDPYTWKVPKGVTYDISPGNECTLPREVDRNAPRLPSDPPYDRAYAENFVIFNAEWSKCADRNGDGKISAEEQQKLNDIVQKAHDAGLRVRLWGGPDGRLRSNPDMHPGHFIHCGWSSCSEEAKLAAWDAQRQAGVDYLNTNHLTAGKDWIQSCAPFRPRQPKPPNPPQPTTQLPKPGMPPAPSSPPNPSPAPSPRPR